MPRREERAELCPLSGAGARRLVTAVTGTSPGLTATILAVPRYHTEGSAEDSAPNFPVPGKASGLTVTVNPNLVRHTHAWIADAHRSADPICYCIAYPGRSGLSAPQICIRCRTFGCDASETNVRSIPNISPSLIGKAGLVSGIRRPSYWRTFRRRQRGSSGG